MAGRKTYTDNFAYEPAGLKERIAAGTLAAVICGIIIAVAPFARMPGPHIAGFIPVVEAIAGASCQVTAATFGAQYRVRGYAPLAILAVAFAMQGVMHGLFLLAFPGVVAAHGIFGRELSAPWIYVLAGFGAIVSVATFVYAEWRESRGRPVGCTFCGVFASVGLGYTLLAATTLLPWLPSLPNLISPAAPGSDTYHRLILPLLLPAQAGCAAALLLVCGLRRRVHLWLLVIVVAGFLDAFGSGVLSGGRFSYGWYAARIETSLSTMFFLIVLHVQLAAILTRASRSSERAHLFYEVIALGGDRPDGIIDGMLSRAALDLDCDWAFLVRLDGDHVVVESNLPGGPYQAGFRTPLRSTLLRHAIERDETLVVDDIARSKWVTDSSGVADVWSAFIAIPVHVDGAIYGAVGFANAARRAKPLDEADLAFVRLVGVLTGSAIERGRQRDQLDELAFFDALTGLPNRLLLHKRLEAQLRSAEASGSRFALQFLDLDDFKSINDTHGHAAGDATLRELGRRLAMAVRADDTVARLGGDEFVVLLPAAEPERVRDTEERIRAIFDEPFAVDGHYHRLGASIGVSYYPADGSTAGALLRAADRELYRVKAERARIA